MTVQTVMTTGVVKLNAADSVRTALKLLIEHDLSGLPVTDAKGLLVGFVSEFDLLLAIEFVGHEIPVSGIMIQNVDSVAPSTPLDVVRRLFVERRHRRVPVTVAGKLVGMVSRRELLRELAEDDPDPIAATKRHASAKPVVTTSAKKKTAPAVKAKTPVKSRAKPKPAAKTKAKTRTRR